MSSIATRLGFETSMTSTRGPGWKTSGSKVVPPDVVIRRFEPADVHPLFDAARESVNELCAWMTWCRPNYSLSDSETFVRNCDAAWASGKQYCFAICDQRDGTFLGSIGISDVDKDHGVANLGYWVRVSRARQGVGTVAARQAARFAFQQLKLARLELLIAVGNVGSQIVAERLGAKPEGILRQRLCLRDQQVDAVLYALLPEDGV